MTGLGCELGHSAVKTVGKEPWVKGQWCPIPIPCFEPELLWLQFPHPYHVRVALEGT